MAFKATRDQRDQRWRIVRNLIAATAITATLQLLCADEPMAQVKAPAKNHLRAPTKATPSAASREDIQSFSIGADGSVANQLAALKIDPADAQAAANAVSQALGKLDTKVTSSGRAVLQSQGAGLPKRLVSLQLYSAKSLAVELHRGADGSFGYKLAPGATEDEDERVSSLPSGGSSGSAARSLVSDSVGIVKASSSTLAANLAPIGASAATMKELTKALAGFAPNATRIDILKGRTVDGAPRILAASVGEGRDKQSFWWFAPPNQPDGWFDDQGRRLGGAMLAEPRPDSRVSSPFGTRRYYGRRSRGGGFHNGIDFEGKVGDPIFAAADGVINHQGWYFNYGRTVKISHADDFETLYAHMSRFADGVGPGARVHKGDLIGYVGSSGRSTGPHLHFSVIVSGQFVNPAPYISEDGGTGALAGQALVVFRQWQQELRKAAIKDEERGSRLFRFLHGEDSWTTNPFAPKGLDSL